MSQFKAYSVWDATVRWFHWINVLCVLGLIAIGVALLNDSALGISNDGKVLLKTVHVWIGYVFALNLLWRFVWAFVGGVYSRWSAILPVGPGYLSENVELYFGLSCWTAATVSRAQSTRSYRRDATAATATDAGDYGADIGGHRSLLSAYWVPDRQLGSCARNRSHHPRAICASYVCQGCLRRHAILSGAHCCHSLLWFLCACSPGADSYNCRSGNRVTRGRHFGLRDVYWEEDTEHAASRSERRRMKVPSEFRPLRIQVREGALST